MTSTKDRPLLTEPLRRTEPPRQKAPQRRVRWIAWAASMVIVGAGVLVAVLLMRGDSEPTAQITEAESAPVFGPVYERGFTNATGTINLWVRSNLQQLEASVGEADRILERYAEDHLAALQASTGEADRILERYAEDHLAALQASTGEADRILERYAEDHLADLQASVGAADWRFVGPPTG